VRYREVNVISDMLSRRMNGFAMIFGKCVWVPSSPKAATIVLAYFFGIVPGLPPAAYEAQLREQLVAAGRTQEAAVAEIQWLDGCFATYTPDSAHRSGG
jgi:hypothetical protein